MIKICYAIRIVSVVLIVGTIGSLDHDVLKARGISQYAKTFTKTLPKSHTRRPDATIHRCHSRIL